MTRLVPLGLAAACLLATTPDAAAKAELTRTGGVLGGTLTYTIEGDPFELFAFLPSTNTGPTPLSILDPLDPRTLGVGIDLLSTLVVSGLGPTGTAVVAFPLPADPSLGGLPIHAQAVQIEVVGGNVVAATSNLGTSVLGQP